MERALGKPHVRVIGLDDGPFRRTDRSAPLVAVALALPGTVEGIERTRASIDGRDATDRALAMLRRSAHLTGARAILLDGATVAGFNPVDLDRLADGTGRPVVSVTRRRPDASAIARAIRKYFPEDAKERIALLERHRPFRASVRGGALYLSAAGAHRREAVALVERSIVVGRWPEPLRLAHLVARALAVRRRAGPGGADRPRRSRRPSSTRSKSSSPRRRSSSRGA